MNIISKFKYSFFFIAGYLVYLFKNSTPGFAHASMINLFCASSGKSNDFINKIISFFSKKYNIENATGLLGNLSDNINLESIISIINKDGYYIFENRLSDEVCDLLLKFSLEEESVIRRMDGQQSEENLLGYYKRGEPQTVRYEFFSEKVINQEQVQTLLSDSSFVKVAQSYFDAIPILDIVHMWWHTDFSNKPDEEAAQYFHFDMDRPKWIKFFIYLTDVKSDNGPHSFVKGSHKSNGIPDSILKKGYSRISDDEIRESYSNDEIIEFIGKKGTIIAEDTRGLHKGKHVEKGDRLILQIQFSNSLFGANYKHGRLEIEKNSRLSVMINKYPLVYKAFSKSVVKR